MLNLAIGGTGESMIAVPPRPAPRPMLTSSVGSWPGTALGVHLDASVQLPVTGEFHSYCVIPPTATLAAAEKIIALASKKTDPRNRPIAFPRAS
jgi:hypothetical protein